MGCEEIGWALERPLVVTDTTCSIVYKEQLACPGNMCKGNAITRQQAGALLPIV
jgi:hypothetical protein